MFTNDNNIFHPKIRSEHEVKEAQLKRSLQNERRITHKYLQGNNVNMLKHISPEKVDNIIK